MIAFLVFIYVFLFCMLDLHPPLGNKNQSTGLKKKKVNKWNHTHKQTECFETALSKTKPLHMDSKRNAWGSWLGFEVAPRPLLPLINMVAVSRGRGKNYKMSSQSSHEMCYLFFIFFFRPGRFQQTSLALSLQTAESARPWLSSLIEAVTAFLITKIGLVSNTKRSGEVAILWSIMERSFLMPGSFTTWRIWTESTFFFVNTGTYILTIHSWK